MEAFKDRASEKGICFGAEDNIASSAADEDFDTVVDNLLKKPNATVVVCFCEGMTVHKLMRATRRKNAEGAFLLIGRYERSYQTAAFSDPVLLLLLERQMVSPVSLINAAVRCRSVRQP